MLAAVGGYAALSVTDRSGLIPIAAGVGVLLLAVGVAFGRPNFPNWAVGLVATTYIASLYLRAAGTDPVSPLVAAGLLSSAELASWSIDSRRGGRDDLDVHIHRLRSIALVVAAGIVLSALVQGAANLGAGGAPLAAAGTVAVLMAVATFCLLMWRSGPRPGSPVRPSNTD